MDFTKELYECKKAAIIAGKKILEIYKTNFEVDFKSDRSPVTKADLVANDTIINILKENFPNYAYLSEESVDDLTRLNNELCFIIDPIDGTQEFVNRTGEFTVNIALAYKQEIVLGVIYAPILDELYFAIKGQGAYKVKERNYTKLNVSSRVNNLVVSESRTHKSIEQEKLFNENKDKISKIYTIGSSLKGCFIAAGIIDAFYRFSGNTKEYDIAAMSIIVKEANGIIFDLNHKEINYNKKDIYNYDGYYIINKKENLFAYEHLKKEKNTSFDSCINKENKI